MPPLSLKTLIGADQEEARSRETLGTRFPLFVILFALIVAVAAKFVRKPRISLTAYKTWDTILTCNIFGYPAPVVSWRRSHKQLPVGRHVISGNEIKILNTTGDDGGAYVCQAANQLGNVMAVTWVVVKDVGEK